MKQSLSVAEARRIALAAQGFAQRRPDAAGTRQLNTRDGTYGDAADRLGQRLRAIALHAAVLAPRAPTTPPRSTGCCSPGARRTWSTGRIWPRSFPPPTGVCSASGWTRRVRSTARRAAGITRIARSSTGCGRAGRPGPAAAGADRARCPRRALAVRGGTGTSSSTRSSTCGCSARWRSRVDAGSSGATGWPSRCSPPSARRAGRARRCDPGAHARGRRARTASARRPIWRTTGASRIGAR